MRKKAKKKCKKKNNISAIFIIAHRRPQAEGNEAEDLTTLNLAHNYLGAKGLEAALGAVTHSDTLRTVDLSHNNLDNAAVDLARPIRPPSRRGGERAHLNSGTRTVNSPPPTHVPRDHPLPAKKQIFWHPPKLKKNKTKKQNTDNHRRVANSRIL